MNDVFALRSMTGYGRKEAGADDIRFTVEVRSLNNRYLDIQVKSPRSLALLEPRVRKSIQERFSRGRFDILIVRSGEQERAGKAVLNESLAEQYVALLRKLKDLYGLEGEVDVATVAGFQDVVTISESQEDPEALWRILSRALSQALDDLGKMRSDEGAVLVRDMTSRIDTVERLIGSVRDRIPATIDNARKRISETLNRLMSDRPDPERLAQEIAVLAERTDVTEELTRLGSHITQFRTLLKGDSNEGVGRKLDFLIQEISREVNTIASKAMDAEISSSVVDMKAELEKIREQAQNIE